MPSSLAIMARDVRGLDQVTEARFMAVGGAVAQPAEQG